MKRLRFADDPEAFVERATADLVARRRRTALRHLARRLRRVTGHWALGPVDSGPQVEVLADAAECIAEGDVVCEERVEQLREAARLVFDIRALGELENVS